MLVLVAGVMRRHNSDILRSSPITHQTKWLEKLIIILQINLIFKA